MTHKRKYRKLLALDMPFEDALERLAEADPDELRKASAGDKDDDPWGFAIDVRGARVSADPMGNICLNDLWSLAGQPEHKRARDWHRSKRAAALEKALEARIVEISHKSPEVVAGSTYQVSGRGTKALTFAHPVLALDYAEYLQPDLAVEIREVFLRYRADDIGLANDILDRIAEQVEEDETRVLNRSEITIRNRELAAQGKRAGCTSWDYAELHNSGYRGLYNGLDADGIHRLKRLTKSQKILDHMNAAEGAANVFRVTQAKIAMQQRRPKTPQEAFEIAHEAGVRTRKAMEEIGGVMPEDMESADGISQAKKRIKENRELLGKVELKTLEKKG